MRSIGLITLFFAVFVFSPNAQTAIAQTPESNINIPTYLDEATDESPPFLHTAFYTFIAVLPPLFYVMMAIAAIRISKGRVWRTELLFLLVILGLFWITSWLASNGYYPGPKSTFVYPVINKYLFVVYAIAGLMSIGWLHKRYKGIMEVNTFSRWLTVSRLVVLGWLLIIVIVI